MAQQGSELRAGPGGAGEAAPTLEAVVAGVVLVDLPLVAEEDAQPAGVLARAVPPLVLRGQSPSAAPLPRGPRPEPRSPQPPSPAAPSPEPRSPQPPAPQPPAPALPTAARSGGAPGALPAASRP